MTSLPMISLNDVHLTLGSDAGPVNILRGIDLEITEGQTVGIVGPSGSGKSTMLAVIAGLEQPSQGSVTVAGTDITHLSEDKLAIFRRKAVGIVFQSFHLVPTMTALENVAVPLELAGDPKAFDKAAQELESLGLGHRLGHYPSQLSGGEQQRVAIARAFAPAPRLVLADEPTGNLDGKTGRAIIDAMFAARDRAGATLVLITHDPGLAQECDRVIRIEDGKVFEEVPGKILKSGAAQ